MKNLVVYSSKTGNTKKLAEAIYNYIPGEKEIYEIDKSPDPNDYTFVALGFHIEGGMPDPKSQEYMKKFNEDHELFLFFTHAADPESKEVKDAILEAKKLVKKARLVGLFNCLGEVPEKVVEEARKKEPVPEWVKNVDSAKGHPNEEDIKKMLKYLDSLDLPW